MRTAESVVLTLWPPGPDERNTSMRRSLSGEVDLDVLGLGQHRDGHRRGVDAALRLGRRHALHAVHAALELEAAEGALALHERDHFLEAAEARRRSTTAPRRASPGARRSACTCGRGRRRRAPPRRRRCRRGSRARCCARRSDRAAAAAAAAVRRARRAALRARAARPRAISRMLRVGDRSSELAVLVDVARRAAGARGSASTVSSSCERSRASLANSRRSAMTRRVDDQTLELLVAPLDLCEPVEHRRPSRPDPRAADAMRIAVASGRAVVASAALAVLPVEALDAAGGVDELLLAREERMARRADLDVDVLLGGAGLDDVATRTEIVAFS